MTGALNVLILEDRPEDAEVMAAELRRGGFDLSWIRADTERDYLAGLSSEVDVILADYSMPGFGALRALELLDESELDIPFIVVTGYLSDEDAAATIRAGAVDYLLKDRLARLGPTVERFLREKKIKAERAAVKTANIELQRTNDARSKLLASVSHELRTPLTAMMAFADILHGNRENNLSARQLDQLDVIRRGGQRIEVLIDDLLDVSRVDAGQFDLEFTPFDFRAAVEEIEEAHTPAFSARGQVLKFDNLPEPTWLNGDRSRVIQVFDNLLTNAHKYSPESTEVNVAVTVEDDVVEVVVVDQGIGISRDDQEFVFEPFFRAANKETCKESGTGLGLVIVKAIVVLHGGRVELESEWGAGTTVRTWFPGVVAEPPEAVAVAEAPAEMSGARRGVNRRAWL